MEYLHFSGYSHSDHVEIYVHPDQRVVVSCWNDGYPNRMGAGGYSMDMPDRLARNYNQEEFICWLKANFWRGVAIDIYKPVEESVVKAFLENALAKTATDSATLKEDSEKTQSAASPKTCTQEKEEPSKQALHPSNTDGLQRTPPSPHKNSKFWAKLCAKLKKGL